MEEIYSGLLLVKEIRAGSLFNLCIQTLTYGLIGKGILYVAYDNKPSLEIGKSVEDSLIHDNLPYNVASFS
jgi:hypothetical protein